LVPSPHKGELADTTPPQIGCINHPSRLKIPRFTPCGFKSHPPHFSNKKEAAQTASFSQAVQIIMGNDQYSIIRGSFIASFTQRFTTESDG
jgi:hypothetical protein